MIHNQPSDLACGPLRNNYRGFAERLRVWWHNFRNRKVARGYRDLSNAMKNDDSFAWAWHCNVVMTLHDNCHGALSHDECNHIGKLMMWQLFDVNVKEPGTW